MTVPDRVTFPFAGTLLEGDVVDAEPQADIASGPDRRLTVDVGGTTYPALESEATPV